MEKKIIFLFFLFYVSYSKVLEISPNIILSKQEINIGQELFYQVNVNKLSPSSSYKIIVHYLGPV